MQSTEDRARPPEELRDEERVPSLPLAGTPPLPALALPWPALRPSQLWLCPGRHSAPPSSGSAYQVQKRLLQLSFLEIHSLAAFVFSSKSSPKPQTFPNQGFKKTKSPS